jgi:hypothetical protein
MGKKTATPEQISDFADALVEVYNEVRGILQLPATGPKDFGGMVHFNGWEVAIHQEVRLAFGLSARIELVYGGSLAPGNARPPRAEVTWASGGGPVSHALAQAQLQLECIGRVAKADLVLHQAWRPVIMAGAEGAVCEELGRRSRAAWEAFRAAHAAEKGNVDG